jgi:hypothetical protein
MKDYDFRRTQDEVASRKRLNQQKKAETQLSPTVPIHLSKKQMVGTNAFTHKSLKRKTLVRPAGFEPATSCLEGAQFKTLSAASGVAYEGTRHLSRP